MNETTYSIFVYSADTLPKEYQNLIYAFWLRSLRYGNEFFKKIDSKSYYDAYNNYIDNILDKPDCKIHLAVLTEDHDVVLGFSISRQYILDYVFVQKELRKNGIASKLIPKGIEVYTHLTKTAQLVLDKKKPDWIFNPFA